MGSDWSVLPASGAEFIYFCLVLLSSLQQGLALEEGYLVGMVASAAGVIVC